MKLLKKILDVIAKIGEVICMVAIAALVLVIVIELLRRNFLDQSYRGTIQLCGISFLWMVFIGLIPLYHDSGLMRLDFLVSRTRGWVAELLYLVNKCFSLLLGIVMIVAFAAQYPFVSTRFYSTFTLQIPYTVQYVPMAIAGAYIALMSAWQIADRLLSYTKQNTKTQGGTLA